MNGQGKPAGDAGWLLSLFPVSWVSTYKDAGTSDARTLEKRHGAAPKSIELWRAHLQTMEDNGRTIVTVGAAAPTVVGKLDTSRFCISGQLKGPLLALTQSVMIVVGSRTGGGGIINMAQKPTPRPGVFCGVLSELDSGKVWYVWRTTK